MKNWSLLACCALALSMVACPGGESGSDGSGGPSPPAPSEPVRETTTDGGSFRVSYQPSPEAIPLNRPFRLKVAVMPTGKGKALPKDLRVTANAGMPGHGHGMNTLPRGRSVGSGTYEFEGFLFHMPGAWQITVDVVKAGESERAVFDVMVK